MPLVIYNTLTRKKETFTPLDPEGKKVTIYNCGPTVYGRFHIGNARNFVVMDIVRRYLSDWLGYDVNFVQNLTDIEDKIIAQAREENISTDEVAKKYTKAYFEDAEKLGIQEADNHPKATDYVDEMIELMKGLETKGLAYESGGSLYFRVRQFAGYGKLSGRSVDDMRTGARVEANEEKEDPLDFVLWKASKPGEPTWDSPWGKGRPGWHTECAVMSRELDETIDIHSGGTDLMFPHHENEIAQREGLTGEPLAHFWMHNGFLNIDSEKMSKSVGNIMKVDDVLEKYSRAAVRYFLLSAHYRHPLDYNQGALDEAKSAVGRVNLGLNTAEEALRQKHGVELRGRDLDRKDPRIEPFIARFEESMNDDFNTPQALAVLQEIVSDIFETLEDEGFDAGRMATLVRAGLELREFFGFGPRIVSGKATLRGTASIRARPRFVNLDVPKALTIVHRSAADAELQNVLELFREKLPDEAYRSLSNGTEALTWESVGGSEHHGDIENLLCDVLDLFNEARKAAREHKAYALADSIRNGLAEAGISFLDRPGGTIWIETEPTETQK